LNFTDPITIGARQDPIDRFFDGEMFDVFLVDGQALTPDVFGYYKKGDGYISAGTSQATDFKKGQWVPKAPKVIKSIINARGGFGVNGFYLPMNDASNFGADFHCEPNSIIKLKGEEDPQPRNGAPTTTDAYVSQLRDDPYKDYLVLAVPGISTYRGPELVSEGTFNTGSTGSWTISRSATLTVVNGKLRVTNTSLTTSGAHLPITCEIGKVYNFSFEIGPIGANFGYVGISDNDTYATGTFPYYYNTLSNGFYSVTFKANATTQYIHLHVFGGSTGNFKDFDNISVREVNEPTDYSTNIKGSGINKTLTANGGAGIANVPSYYESALSSAANGGFSFEGSDFAFGTGDFTFEGWFYISSDTSVIRTIFDTRTTDNNQFGLFLGINDNDNLYTYGFPSGAGVTDLGIPAINQWHHVAVERNRSIGTVYLNGVAVSTVNMSSTNYTQSGGTLMRPAAVFGDLYNFYGYVQDFRVYKGVAKYKGGFDVPKPYTPVGIETWRAVPDTTANNFATLNAVQINRPTFSDGNLSWSATTAYRYGQGTVAVPKTGKWVFEGRFNNNTTTNNYNSIGVGINTTPVALPFNISGNYGINDASATFGQSFIQNGVRQGSITLGAGDIIQVLIDRDNNQMNFVKNGTLQTGTGSIVTIPSDVDLYTMIGEWNLSGQINFGQNPTFSGNTTAGTFTDSNGKGLFKYQPPSGFLALCEDNLPTPAIKNPGEYFKTVLYTGDGNGGRSITGVGFKPDLVWIKRRTGASDHILQDSVRGFGPVTKLASSSTQKENDTTSGGSFGITDPQWGYLTSANYDGFSLAVSSGGGFDQANRSGDTYAAWCWKAGGPAVTNTDGTITSQVSVNQDAGFSIVSWTGNGSTSTETVGHGLNKIPSFTIVKARDNATTDSASNDWWVYFGTNDNTRLRLNLTTSGFSNGLNAVKHATNFGRFTLDSTTTVFKESGVRYIAYSWAEIEGFSKFGSYVGNGSADGPFVYCGFKPAFIITKRIDSTSSWHIADNARNSTNPNQARVWAEAAQAEVDDTTNPFDFLSNGFKLRGSGTGTNASAGTYIFAAFAESPFQTANAK
jgi:hypothetical protein